MKKKLQIWTMAVICIPFLTLGCVLYPYDYWEEEIVVEETYDYYDPYYGASSYDSSLIIQLTWDSWSLADPHVDYRDLSLELVTPYGFHLAYYGDQADGCSHLGFDPGPGETWSETIECVAPLHGYYEIRVVNSGMEMWEPMVITTFVERSYEEDIVSETYKEIFVDAWGTNVIPLLIE